MESQPARGLWRANPYMLTAIYIRLRARIIEHFCPAGPGTVPACARSRMFDYVYTDHAQYTIKMYAKMALFPLILTGPLSTAVPVDT